MVEQDAHNVQVAWFDSGSSYHFIHQDFRILPS